MLVGYARVSTIDQNLDLQLDAFKAAGVETIFTERASGAKRARPELNKAIKALNPGDTLVVWKLDRLARSLSHLVDLVALLEKHGVGLRSLTELLDTGGPQGRLMFHIFAAIGEFERGMIRERVLAGQKAAKARGVKFGPKPKIPDETFELARSLVTEGDTIAAVSRTLKISRSRLYERRAAERALWPPDIPANRFARRKRELTKSVLAEYPHVV